MGVEIKKLLYILAFTLSCSAACAQDIEGEDSIPVNPYNFRKGWVAHHLVLDIFGGVFYCNLKNLNAGLSQQYNKTISNSVNSIGFSSYNTLVLSRDYLYFDARFNYQYILPAEHQFTDSLSFKMAGYHIGFDCGKELFPKQEHFDLYVGIGFNFGRLKLLKKDLEISDDYLKYTNPFFAPKAVLEPKLLLGRLVISVKAEYLADISKDSWKLRDPVLPAIGTAKSTGFFVQGGIGLKLR